MAAAYTVFANAGLRISPVMVNSVRNAAGDVVMDFKPDKRQVLDPRVAYVMTNMMEGVLNFGTAYRVRTRGFTAPAAGKTGTSHDGWFAGYTSNLLCIVWVGFDDYSDIRLSGAQTAAPIWAEFMKKAVALPAILRCEIVRATRRGRGCAVRQEHELLATPACPETYTAAFIAGTEPNQTCDQPAGVKGFFSRIFGLGEKALPPPLPGHAGCCPARRGHTGCQFYRPGWKRKKRGFLAKLRVSLKMINRLTLRPIHRHRREMGPSEGTLFALKVSMSV